MRKRITSAVFLVGFTSMIAQIVLMRELMVVFYGNELSLGLSLAMWLFWVAVGSWTMGRFLIRHLKDKLASFCAGETSLAFILPFSLFGTRLIPWIIGVLPGEVVGVLPMMFSTFLTLAPVCLVGGALFVLGCQIYPLEGRKEDSAQIGYVYLLEAIGAGLGGLLAGFLLIRLLWPFYIMTALATLNLIASLLLQLRKRRALFVLNALLLVAAFWLLFSGNVTRLRKASLKAQWRTFELITSRNSIYGNVAVTKRENSFSLFVNGLHAFTVPDRLTAETVAHFPLLEHPHPEEVLLIGGGMGGVLEEILKHPVKRIDYVELDPLVIRLAKKFMPEADTFWPRVNIITDTDGRLFIKKTSGKYDVIIVNLPEPHTAQLNRFYTKEFFQEASRIMKDPSVLGFLMYSNPNYISDEQRQFYLSVRETLNSVFPQVVITPGQANYFMASNREGLLTLDWQRLIQRLKEREIKAMYFREYYLFSELSRERIKAFQGRLASGSVAKVNYDFRPISYYYDMVLWNTYFKYNLNKLLKATTERRLYLIFSLICLVILTPLWLERFSQKRQLFGILTAVTTTGFAEISFQIVTLLAFQILYGYVYYKLAIILSSYMVGLILGSYLASRMLQAGKGDIGTFIKTQVAIVLYPFILPVLFWMFQGARGELSFYIGSNILFPFLPLIPGIIGGFQFPLANRLYIKGRWRLPSGQPTRTVGHSAGLTYGLDLFGSCLGAILVSVFFLPVIGIPMTCLAVAILNTVSLILLTFRRTCPTLEVG
jgi:spermidine synthase